MASPLRVVAELSLLHKGHTQRGGWPCVVPQHPVSRRRLEPGNEQRLHSEISGTFVISVTSSFITKSLPEWILTEK